MKSARILNEQTTGPQCQPGIPLTFDQLLEERETAIQMYTSVFGRVIQYIIAR